jgi:hypothetical protein
VVVVHWDINTDKILPENKPKLTANDRISDILSCAPLLLGTRVDACTKDDEIKKPPLLQT